MAISTMEMIGQEIAAQALAVVKEIADSDPIMDTGEGYSICRHCDGAFRGDFSTARSRTRLVFHHEDDCLYLRARKVIYGD